jgi:hypothetical protein
MAYILEHEGLRFSNVRLGVQYPPHTRRSPLSVSKMRLLLLADAATRLFSVRLRSFPSSHTRGMYGLFMHTVLHITTLGTFLIRGFQHGGHMVGFIRRVRVAVLSLDVFVAGRRRVR